ncbi:helix-turn-helix transcriptional regulator [Runella sp. MFBS21]|uniref:helix-turn-helix transcriptional regulator n=1 Tax=Runella sp. MFBS21 TaxID=3034018 RepID=UPI0023F7BB54|nr:helix-turn-helix transcriptional regulator [Runella sp. MFBS21]MDF7821621.1 helix-turn-helix transcriptional regulator [Runella sp. MFBS21]
MPPRIDIFAIVILLGVVQGILLGGLFLTGTRATSVANRTLGWIMWAYSAAIFEIFLCYTNYQFQTLWADNFAEPTNFLLAVLPYFFVHARLHGRLPKHWQWHLLPFGFWCLYSIFWQYQSYDYKYNSYITAWHPELSYRPFTYWIPEDPLYLRDHVNDLTLFSILIYIGLSLKEVYLSFKKNQLPFFTRQTAVPLTQVRNYVFLFCLFPMVFVGVKLSFQKDLGDYLLGSLVTFYIYATSYLTLSHSVLFQVENTVENRKKYEKSSLSEDNGEVILQKLQTYLQTQKPYLENDLTLPKLAQRLSVSQHHLSQVLNDRLGQSFFDLMAKCRVEEAQKLLTDGAHMHLKIDEIAEQVGYNSTSAFHTAFKRITGQTPAQYRAKFLN